MNRSSFLPLVIGGFFVCAAVIGADNTADNKGAEIILLKGGKMRDVHFPHYRHQNVLGDCNVCHELFPARAGSIAELKGQGKLKKKQVMEEHCIALPVTNKKRLLERKPARPPVLDVTKIPDSQMRHFKR